MKTTICPCNPTCECGPNCTWPQLHHPVTD